MATPISGAHPGAGGEGAKSTLAGRLRAALAQPGPVFGIAASLVAVALVTAAIAILKRWVPVLSLGALYVFAVLPIAVGWGLAYGVAVSVASMLAFNWFFLEPVHTFTLADSKNWLALAVFVVTAIVVSELAARSRRRAREASLLAEIATSLLEHGTVGDELERISAEAARALQGRDQDRRAARREPRSANAADGDLHLGRRSRPQ
jgi:K+-sensing histidine kinase KdpD